MSFHKMLLPLAETAGLYWKK